LFGGIGISRRRFVHDGNGRGGNASLDSRATP
jgi:hypothetical protein